MVSWRLVPPLFALFWPQVRTHIALHAKPVILSESCIWWEPYLQTFDDKHLNICTYVTNGFCASSRCLFHGLHGLSSELCLSTGSLSFLQLSSCHPVICFIYIGHTWSCWIAMFSTLNWVFTLQIQNSEAHFHFSSLPLSESRADPAVVPTASFLRSHAGHSTSTEALTILDVSSGLQIDQN